MKKIWTDSGFLGMNFWLIFIVISVLIVHTSEAQERNIQKQDLYIDLGFKYIPLDYIGGPAFGLSLYSPDKKLSFTFRYDMPFSIGKEMVPMLMDSIYYRTPGEAFQVKDFQIRTYFDLEYLLWNSMRNKKLSVGVGVGWIYDSFNEKYFLSVESGYYCVTLSAKYKFSWFFIEPRVDIALPKSENAHLWQPHFPGSVALIYRFKPKATE